MGLVRLTAVLLLTSVPTLVSAQGLAERPDLVLNGVPFQLTVIGGAEPVASGTHRLFGAYTNWLSPTSKLHWRWSWLPTGSTQLSLH